MLSTSLSINHTTNSRVCTWGKSLVSAHGLTAVYLNINVDTFGMQQCLDVIQVMCETLHAHFMFGLALHLTAKQN